MSSTFLFASRSDGRSSVNRKFPKKNEDDQGVTTKTIQVIDLIEQTSPKKYEVFFAW